MKPTYEIFREFTFDAAHSLPQAPEGHKCRRLHGHTFRVVLGVEGVPDIDTGWIRDFAELKAQFSPILDMLDHRHLNDIEGLENPTSERLAQWIYQRSKVDLSDLVYVQVRETCTTGCTYRES